jgi:hypothetical protein
MSGNASISYPITRIWGASRSACDAEPIDVFSCINSPQSLSATELPKQN